MPYKRYQSILLQKYFSVDLLYRVHAARTGAARAANVKCIADVNPRRGYNRSQRTSAGRLSVSQPLLLNLNAYKVAVLPSESAQAVQPQLHLSVFIVSHWRRCLMRMWFRTELGCAKKRAHDSTGQTGLSRG